MTWWEYLRCLEGYNNKLKSQHQELAWAVCTIGNRIPYNKKPLRYNELIGKKTKEFRSAKEFREYMESRAGE